tara:strand:+ start:878 stop:1096 length:219 start_codon:yes stop_codon:yes gene_type:complete
MDAYTFGTLVGALSSGILCGIVPLKLGKKHNKEGWGKAGLITSTIGGLVLGLLLAVPLAGVFSAIILVSIDN